MTVRITTNRLRRSPRRAYRVVDDFESELCDFTGALYAVTVDSCTNSLYLALVHEREFGGRFKVTLPRHTYVGVLQAALNADYKVEWASEDWHWTNMYDLVPTRIVDAARCFTRMTYEPKRLTCLSFHAAKQLSLGRGGAILTDDPQAAEWFMAARMDGRPPGAPIEATQFPGFHCPMSPDVAARGLWTLSRWNDSGYSPPPLPHENYPDLSLIYPGNK